MLNELSLNLSNGLKMENKSIQLFNLGHSDELYDFIKEKFDLNIKKLFLLIDQNSEKLWSTLSLQTVKNNEEFETEIKKLIKDYDEFVIYTDQITHKLFEIIKAKLRIKATSSNNNAPFFNDFPSFENMIALQDNAFIENIKVLIKFYAESKDNINALIRAICLHEYKNIGQIFAEVTKNHAVNIRRALAYDLFKERIRPIFLAVRTGCNEFIINNLQHIEKSTQQYMDGEVNLADYALLYNNLEVFCVLIENDFDEPIKFERQKYEKVKKLAKTGVQMAKSSITSENVAVTAAHALSYVVPYGAALRGILTASTVVKNGISFLTSSQAPTEVIKENIKNATNLGKTIINEASSFIKEPTYIADVKDNFGLNPLFIATQRGYFNCMDRLVTQMNFNFENLFSKDGNNVLFYVFNCQNFAIYDFFANKFFIKHCSKFHTKTTNKQVLEKLISHKNQHNISVLEYILVNKKYKEFLFFVEYFFAYKELMLTFFTYFDGKDIVGLIKIGFSEKLEKSIICLVSYSKDPNIIIDGKPLIFMSIESKSRNLTSFLLHEMVGFNLNAIDVSGRNIIHFLLDNFIISKNDKEYWLENLGKFLNLPELNKNTQDKNKLNFIEKLEKALKNKDIDDAEYKIIKNLYENRLEKSSIQDALNNNYFSSSPQKNINFEEVKNEQNFSNQNLEAKEKIPIGKVEVKELSAVEALYQIMNNKG